MQREARQRGGMRAAVVACGVGMCAVLLVVYVVPRHGAGERGELLGVGEQPRMGSSLAELAAAEKRQRQSLGAAARAAGFTQPGYDNKHPKGLWGKGVPLEYREDDFQLIKALAAVEKDIDSSQEQMDSIDRKLSRQKAQNPSRVSMPSWWPVNSNQPASMQMPSEEREPTVVEMPEQTSSPQPRTHKSQESWWPARNRRSKQVAGYMGQRTLAKSVKGMSRQSLKDWGVPWASPVTQGYPGAEVLGGPYVPTEFTEDVLETQDQKKLSSEGRWPYVKYYGQPTSFIDGNELDINFYNYQDGFDGSEYDSLPDAYDSYLNQFD